MSPIKYVEFTRAIFTAQGFPPYEWIVNETAPFTPFQKNLDGPGRIRTRDTQVCSVIPPSREGS